MNVALWVLQGLAALLFGASGIMKTFMFDKVSADVPSFGALPRNIWFVLGLIELVCAAGLIAPAITGWRTYLVSAAAAILAAETILFVWVHVKYRETAPVMMNIALGLLMALLACGRFFLRPL